MRSHQTWMLTSPDCREAELVTDAQSSPVEAAGCPMAVLVRLRMHAKVRSFVLCMSVVVCCNVLKQFIQTFRHTPQVELPPELCELSLSCTTDKMWVTEKWASAWIWKEGLVLFALYLLSIANPFSTVGLQAELYTSLRLFDRGDATAFGKARGVIRSNRRRYRFDYKETRDFRGKEQVGNGISAEKRACIASE